ncbi:MAG TPA: lamin tail domain-containing protein, partial [Candidatus Limnocylindria bacterium]|nr:lamin tail domain-containing protein [Candidatus Limnocylindria bacterium]
MRRAVVGMSLAVTLVALASTPMASPRIAAAAGCVRFLASNFDAAGNDHTNENGEWVRIKNVCSTGKDIGGWQIHDYGRIHVYRFPAGFRLGAG